MRLNKLYLCLFVSLGILGIPVNSSAASSPLDYKTFVYGAALWICDPAGILMYRNDTRSVRSIVLCDTVDNDSIFDIAENNAMLWVLARSGVYQIDLSTTTIEKLPGGKKGMGTNRLSVDDDYVWVTLNDTLWRFDKLGREWFPYFINTNNSPLRGVFSNGTNVYCVLPSSIKIFSTKDEKWLEFSYKKGMTISPNALFFLDKNTLVLVDGPFIYRYLINSQSWDVIPTQSPVIDMLSQDTALYYLTQTGMFKYTTATSVTQPQDVPELARVHSFARFNDTLFCATTTNFIKYDMTAKISGNIQAPLNIADYRVLKTIILGNTLVVLCPKNIGVFDQKSQFWENVNISFAGKKTKRLTWDDDNGLKLSYAKGYDSQLKGSVQKDYIIDSLINRNDSLHLTYTDPVPIISLTLHSTFSQGRYLDAFFDNSDISQVPRKGLFYRGDPSDRVESGRLGTNIIDNSQLKTILPSSYEGVNALIQSKTSLASRDRKIVKAQAGAGLLISRTITKVLPYVESGLYNIKDVSTKDTTAIIPGSLKVNIDGEDIDSTSFSLVLRTGSLIFNRQDLLDPTSVITISYQIRTVPDSGLQQVEALPKNNFGKLGYASVSVSPVDWISPQIGFYYLKTDSLHKLINVAFPAEIRSTWPALFLKLTPELTYDDATGNKAAGLSLQSRFGEKLSIFMNGLLPDSGYKTTDNLERGYGYLKHNADFTVSYDIKKELPVSYYQSDIVSANGVEQRYEFSVGSHFQNFPFCDLTLSRNVVDGRRTDTLSAVKIDSTITGAVVRIDTIRSDSVVHDTLDRLKDKFRIRLYETSSPFVESALHINRLSYDLSYTGYALEKDHKDQSGSGDIFYGTGTISPIKRVTLTANGLYFKNPIGSYYGTMYNPTISLQTIDAPPGIDLSASNTLTFKSVPDSNTSNATLSRAFNVTIKPGAWTKTLGWISPLLGINQNINCGFNDVAPGFDALVLGNKDVMSKSLNKSIGANVFPTNDIIFHDENQFTTADSLMRYHTLNDLKWWFGQQRLWQTRWEYYRDRPSIGVGRKKDQHSGTTQFTDNWNSWLQTITGVSSSFVATDSSKSTSVGPMATISIIKQKVLFIRNLINNHTLNLSWTKEQGVISSSPDIAYTMYFKIVVFPNISFFTNDAFTFSRGTFIKYNGNISAALIF